MPSFQVGDWIVRENFLPAQVLAISGTGYSVKSWSLEHEENELVPQNCLYRFKKAKAPVYKYKDYVMKKAQDGFIVAQIVDFDGEQYAVETQVDQPVAEWHHEQELMPLQLSGEIMRLVLEKEDDFVKVAKTE